MSLFQVIRRYLVLTLLVTLVLGCLSLFFIFKTFIHQTADQTLYEYKERIENYINLNDTLILFKSSLQIPQRIESQIVDNVNSYKQGIIDTLLYNEGTGYFQPYRQLSFIGTYKNKHHLITINQPSIEMNDLLYVILGSLFAIFILFLLFTYFISYNLKKKIWAPFYRTLAVLKEYNVERELGQNIELEQSGIEEFDMLNQTVQRMVARINTDYENMKTFSEDISHEMQTPLAIIRSKIEILRQDKLEEKAYLESLLVMFRSVTRLSKLNSSLLLLTKITNDQYQSTDSVDFADVLEQQLSALDELISMKGICVELDISSSTHFINSVLSDILLSNLLNNAIRHNIKNGFIRISLDALGLIVVNSCEEVNLNNVPDLFGRLVSLKAKGSTGLGLSIVKSICDKNNIQVVYRYNSSDVFEIALSFKDESKFSAN